MDNVTLDELLVTIKQEWAKLAPLIDLDAVEELRAPGGQEQVAATEEQRARAGRGGTRPAASRRTSPSFPARRLGGIFAGRTESRLQESGLETTAQEHSMDTRSQISLPFIFKSNLAIQLLVVRDDEATTLGKP